MFNLQFLFVRNFFGGAAAGILARDFGLLPEAFIVF